MLNRRLARSVVVWHQYQLETSIDVLPSKNQALCQYCTHVGSY